MSLAILGNQPHFPTPQHVGGPIVELQTRDRFHALADEAFARNYLTNTGPHAELLEQEIARIHNTKEAVLVANGFLAQFLLLHCLNLTHGEAIIPANTFVATAHACEMAGLKPVFCDLDPQTLCIDVDHAESLITPQTRLIIPTHVFGVFADMPRLVSLCQKHGISLIADAAHAFMCDQNGTGPGNFGVPEFLSFHATKFFSTLEGGAILTNDPALADLARSMRNFGFYLPNDATNPGMNAKISEIHAAFGLASLPILEARRAGLKAVSDAYSRRLAHIPGLRIHRMDQSGQNNYRYFALFIEDDFPLTRDEVDHALRQENILPRHYFWPGCHRMGHYARQGCPALPKTDNALARILCLPTSFVGATQQHSAEALAESVADLLIAIRDNAPAVRDAVAKATISAQ